MNDMSTESSDPMPVALQELIVGILGNINKDKPGLFTNDAGV